MKYYTEPSREIPVAAETEVLVVGVLVLESSLREELY